MQEMEKCSNCKGVGQRMGMGYMLLECSACLGKGKIIKKEEPKPSESKTELCSLADIFKPPSMKALDLDKKPKKGRPARGAK